MTWNLKDSDTRAAITSGIAPPSSAESIFGDTTWAGIFSQWATDLGFDRGDYKASYLYRFWVDYSHNVPGDQVKSDYVDSGAPYALEWPSSVHDRFESAMNGTGDMSSALSEMRNASVEMLDRYVSMFRDDIAQIQSEAASEPTEVRLTRDRIDQGVVDATNQAAMKALPEAGGVQSFAEFWHLGDLVLIGPDHPATYVDYVKSNGGIKGQLYMNAKGGVTSRGEIMVQGVSSSNSDEFKSAIARFSKKKVKFV